MKTATIRLFWAMCLCSLSFGATAQNKHSGYHRIKAVKMSYILEKSAFSPEEEALFWPIYDKYEDSIHRKTRHKLYQIKKEYINKLRTISNSEAAAIIEKIHQLEILKIQQTQNRNKALTEALGAAKTLIILDAENQFSKEMFHRSKNKSRENKSVGDSRN